MSTARIHLVLALACIATVAGPATARAAATVHPPIVAEPAHQPPRGEVVLVHGGGWSGPDRGAQQAIMEFARAPFLSRGHRVSSVDYRAGRDGLRDVLAAVDAAATRTRGSVCLYGESAGGHLSLLAAARRPGVDCVVAHSAPTDFAAWERDAQAGVVSVTSARLLRVLVPRHFGPLDSAEAAAWSPASSLHRIRGDVLVILGRGDVIVPESQLAAVLAAVPGAEAARPAAAEPGEPVARRFHGVLSATGARETHEAIGALVDRVQAAQSTARRWWRRTRCPGLHVRSGRSAGRHFERAVACAVRRAVRDRDLGGRVASRAATVVLPAGQPSPAVVAEALTRDPRARALLRAACGRPGSIAIRIGRPSTVTLPASAAHPSASSSTATRRCRRRQDGAAR